MIKITDRLSIKLYSFKMRINRKFMEKFCSCYQPESNRCFKKKRKELAKEFVGLCHSSDIPSIESFLSRLDEEELTALWLNLSTSRDSNFVGLLSIIVAIISLLTAVLVGVRSELYAKWGRAPSDLAREKIDNGIFISGVVIIGFIIISALILIILGCYLYNLHIERYPTEIVRIYREKKTLFEPEENKTARKNLLPSKFDNIQEINKALKGMKRKRAVKMDYLREEQKTK